MIRRACFVLLSLLLVPGWTSAQESSRDSTPIEIALWPGVQIAEGRDVSGIRIALYGKNPNLSGLDFSLVGRTTGDLSGIQFGFVGVVDGDLAGAQVGEAVNIVRGEVSGFQAGFFNQAGSGGLGQLGALNIVDRSAEGFQVGAANLSESMSGAFAGIANVSRGSAEGAWFGIVNSVDDGGGFMFGVVNVANRFRGLQIGLVNIINSKDSFPVLPIVNWVF